MLMCLPTHAWHHARDVRKAPARHPGPTASNAAVALLIVLNAGAAPCAMSAPWGTHATTQGWVTGHNLSACPAHAALSTPAGPPARPIPTLRPPPPRPQHANPIPASPDTGTRRARWSIAGMIAAATLLLAHPYLADAADHHHGPHRRHRQHRGDGAASAARAEAAPRNAHSAPTSGASDQPLEVYPHPRAQQSDDMVATSRDANAQGLHAARGGAHADRMRRSGNRIYIADDRSEAAGDAPDSGSDAGGQRQRRRRQSQRPRDLHAPPVRPGMLHQRRRRTTQRLHEPGHRRYQWCPSLGDCCRRPWPSQTPPCPAGRYTPPSRIPGHHSLAPSSRRHWRLLHDRRSHRRTRRAPPARRLLARPAHAPPVARSSAW